MLIKGFQKLTLLDFPEKTACTVFTGGCNLRCPFCHNAPLVTEIDDYTVSEDEIFSHLEKRKGILDGVAITGGEPLLQKDIAEFISKIKNLGYSVKLDTNGCFPEKLRELVNSSLIDYVAVDIKNSKEKYAETVGIKNFSTEKIEESVDFLISSNIDFEFRTTITGNFHTVKDVENIAKWIKGTKKYFLQNFIDSGNLIDSNCYGVSKDIMNEMLEKVRILIPETQLRGL